MTSLTKLAAGTSLVLSLTALAPSAEAGDCMRDEAGNFWGDCSNGYDANGAPTTITVYAPAPPSTTETAFNIITNWTGPWGSVVSTVNALVQWAGGWDAMGEAYYNTCSQSPYACWPY